MRTLRIFLDMYTNTKKELRDFKIPLAYSRQVTVNIFLVETCLSVFETSVSELLANSDVHVLYFVDL